MKILNKLSNYNNKKSLGNKFRNKRFKFFKSKLENQNISALKILDIGGNETFWIQRNFANKDNISIVLLNLYKKKSISSNIN